MPQYRKKPVVIEAVRAGDVLASPIDDWSDLPCWLHEAWIAGVVSFSPGRVTIETLEGRVLTGGEDDMIIRGVEGELYPCKGEIFAATYEAVA